MKVYVDELPKDCWDCPMHDGENGWCKMLVCYTDYIPKNCPLQSLADYTKQVRKEVCQEIRDKMTHWEDCLTKEVTEYVIDKETLDKIEQGEIKCK